MYDQLYSDQKLIAKLQKQLKKLKKKYKALKFYCEHQPVEGYYPY